MNFSRLCVIMIFWKDEMVVNGRPWALLNTIFFSRSCSAVVHERDGHGRNDGIGNSRLILQFACVYMSVKKMCIQNNICLFNCYIYSPSLDFYFF